LAIAWQNVGYNQPPHPSFYLGEGMTLPVPQPDIVLDGSASGSSSGSSSGGIVSIEAEDGTLGDRWNIGYHTGASNGAFIEIDPSYNNGTSSPECTSAECVASYSFDISSSGNHRFWFRIVSENGSDDSFFWRIDDGSWNLENNRWGFGNWYLTDNSQVDSLNAGSHVLEISYRENGTRLDKFVIQLDSAPMPCGDNSINNAVSINITGLKKIFNRASGKCLDAGGNYDGANIQIWRYWGGSNQKWSVADVAGGMYSIRSTMTGSRSLDCAGLGISNGTNVQLYSYWGGANQIFAAYYVSSDYYRISPAHALGQCLDAWGTSNGSNVGTWSYWGGTNQQWSFSAP
ncbi:RICIN domain-containing protein, partial [candidate division KSB1 bacterium]|nr:RICIN domain-containing protein [candidate division KSB1 bacterium]